MFIVSCFNLNLNKYDKINHMNSKKKNINSFLEHVVILVKFQFNLN